MNKENTVLFSNFYEGSSFDEIYQSCVDASSKMPIDIHIECIKAHKSSEYLKQDNLLDGQEDIECMLESLKFIFKEKKIQKLLLGDFFMPGLDLVQYYREITRSKLKLGGLLHGGTFLEGDIYQWDWLKKSESLWTKIFDVIYVPSHYLLNQLPPEMQEKSIVYPWGMQQIKIPSIVPFHERKYDIVFPHRLDQDKGVNDLKEIIQRLPNVQFLITSPVPVDDTNAGTQEILKSRNVSFRLISDNNDHLRSLTESRLILSTAKQENFGFSIAKGVLCGCIPVLPNFLVYPELYPKSALYEDIDNACNNITRVLEDKEYRTHLEHDLTVSLENLRSCDMQNLLRHFFES